MFFPSPIYGRWWKNPLITFQRIWLVRPRPHANYTRTVYSYITGSGCYANSYWAQQLYIYLLLDTSWEEAIVIYICSIVQHATNSPVMYLPVTTPMNWMIPPTKTDQNLPSNYHTSKGQIQSHHYPPLTPPPNTLIPLCTTWTI